MVNTIDGGGGKSVTPKLNNTGTSGNTSGNVSVKPIQQNPVNTSTPPANVKLESTPVKDTFQKTISLGPETLNTGGVHLEDKFTKNLGVTPPKVQEKPDREYVEGRENPHTYASKDNDSIYTKNMSVKTQVSPSDELKEYIEGQEKSQTTTSPYNASENDYKKSQDILKELGLPENEIIGTGIDASKLETKKDYEDIQKVAEKNGHHKTEVVGTGIDTSKLEKQKDIDEFNKKIEENSSLEIYTGPKPIEEELSLLDTKKALEPPKEKQSFWKKAENFTYNAAQDVKKGANNVWREVKSWFDPDLKEQLKAEKQMELEAKQRVREQEREKAEEEINSFIKDNGSFIKENEKTKIQDLINQKNNEDALKQANIDEFNKKIIENSKLEITTEPEPTKFSLLSDKEKTLVLPEEKVDVTKNKQGFIGNVKSFANNAWIHTGNGVKTAAGWVSQNAAIAYNWTSKQVGKAYSWVSKTFNGWFHKPSQEEKEIYQTVYYDYKK